MRNKELQHDGCGGFVEYRTGVHNEKVWGIDKQRVSYCSVGLHFVVSNSSIGCRPAYLWTFDVVKEWKAATEISGMRRSSVRKCGNEKVSGKSLWSYFNDIRITLVHSNYMVVFVWLVQCWSQTSLYLCVLNNVQWTSNLSTFLERINIGRISIYRGEIKQLISFVVATWSVGEANCIIIGETIRVAHNLCVEILHC